jgi:hypothetical protein
MKYLSPRIEKLKDSIYDYEALTLFPLLFGGKISEESKSKDEKEVTEYQPGGGAISFPPGSEGDKLLEMYADEFMDSGLVRIHFNEIKHTYDLSYPYPFIKRTMAQKYFKDNDWVCFGWFINKSRC